MTKVKETKVLKIEGPLTNGEFLELYNLASRLSNSLFNDLGYACRKFVRAAKKFYSNIEDKKYIMKGSLAIKEGESIKKDQNGEPILKADQESVYLEKLNAFLDKKSEFTIEALDPSVFTPIRLSKEELKMPPVMFDILEAFIILNTSSEYLAAIKDEQKVKQEIED
jgi:hypothetical protein